MTEASDDSRTYGVELGSLEDELESEDYPISHDELLERYGDHEIDLQGENTTLREVLEPEMEREYQDVEGVRQSIFNMVGDEAVGREGYSDRGGSTPEDGPVDDEDESV